MSYRLSPDGGGMAGKIAGFPCAGARLPSRWSGRPSYQGRVKPTGQRVIRPEPSGYDPRQFAVIPDRVGFRSREALENLVADHLVVVSDRRRVVHLVTGGDENDIDVRVLQVRQVAFLAFTPIRLLALFIGHTVRQPF